jgi:hypothetical protein
MQTRSKTKIGPYKTLFATNQPLSSIDLHPTSYTHASKVSHWRDAVVSELDALARNVLGSWYQQLKQLMLWVVNGYSKQKGGLMGQLSVIKHV